MFTANPREHLEIGQPGRRCWSCDAFTEFDRMPAEAQPLGTCTRVRWMMRVGKVDVRQDVHGDDVCKRFEPAFASVDEREMRATAAGLG